MERIKPHLLISIIIVLVVVASYSFIQRSRMKTVSETQLKSTMEITSPVFSTGEQIPMKYTCDGENISPALQIKNVPDSAKSLALILDDPDAPAGNWTHWIVWNIAPETLLISEGTAPAGSVEGKNSWGKTGYGGPCPPSGIHRYFFKLYALDSSLSLPVGSDKAALQKEIEGHTLVTAELVGRYSR